MDKQNIRYLSIVKEEEKKRFPKSNVYYINLFNSDIKYYICYTFYNIELYLDVIIHPNKMKYFKKLGFYEDDNIGRHFPKEKVCVTDVMNFNYKQTNYINCMIEIINYVALIEKDRYSNEFWREYEKEENGR